jgi:uncharacterized membrane protein YfcA
MTAATRARRPCGLPALGIGAVLSRLVHERVNGRALRIFVVVFSIVSGLVLILRAWASRTIEGRRSKRRSTRSIR